MIIKTLDGNILPPGKVKRSLETSFLEGTLPSWLTVAAGTQGFGPPASSDQKFYIDTAATADSNAKIELTREINLSSFRAIFWTIEGLFTDVDDDVLLSISMSDGVNQGVDVFQKSTSALPVSRLTGQASTDESVNYKLRGNGEATSHRNLTLAVFPPTNEIYLLEDDQVMYKRKFTTMNKGAVKPAFTYQTKLAVSRMLSMYKVRLDCYQD